MATAASVDVAREDATPGPPLPAARATAPSGAAPATSLQGPGAVVEEDATAAASITPSGTLRTPARLGPKAPAPAEGGRPEAPRPGVPGRTPPTTTRAAESALAAPASDAPPPADLPPVASEHAPDAPVAASLPLAAPISPKRSSSPTETAGDALTPQVAHMSGAPPAQAADAPAASPPPRALPTTPPSRQLAPILVAVAIGGGTARLSVTLEPVELGRVEVSVERSGEGSQVRILAERPETLALLQRDQRELDRALTAAGIGAEGRSVSLGLAHGGHGGAEGQGRQHPHGGEARMARGVLSAGDTGTVAAEPPRRLLSLLDLAV